MFCGHYACKYVEQKNMLFNHLLLPLEKGLVEIGIISHFFFKAKHLSSLVTLTKNLVLTLFLNQ